MLVAFHSRDSSSVYRVKSKYNIKMYINVFTSYFDDNKMLT